MMTPERLAEIRSVSLTPWADTEIAELLAEVERLQADLAAMHAASDERIKAALEVAEHYGGIDGAHHKHWVIDQMVRAMTAHEYEKWVEEMTTGNNAGYDWDVGIPP